MYFCSISKLSIDFGVCGEHGKLKVCRCRGVPFKGNPPPRLVDDPSLGRPSSSAELPGLLRADPPLGRRQSPLPGFHGSQQPPGPTGLGDEFHPSGVTRIGDVPVNTSLAIPLMRKLGDGVDNEAGEGVDRRGKPIGVCGVWRVADGSPGDGEFGDIFDEGKLIPFSLNGLGLRGAGLPVPLGPGMRSAGLLPFPARNCASNSFNLLSNEVAILLQNNELL